MKQYHVITHTHWDREWYFTKEETKVLLRQHMLDLFDYLSENPDIIYILDGQTVMIDDFLEINPEYEETLRKYIESGNIRVGPWYTQTDLMLTRGESIVRNLYYGLKLAKEYTDTPMLVGYAPDTFGHNAQMPQIYKGFNIDSTFFWRGVSNTLSKRSNFIWEAMDGSKVFSHSLASGYQGGKYLLNDVDDLKTRVSEIEGRYEKFETVDDIIVMNGHDQMPVQRNLPEIMETFNKYTDGEMFNTDFETYVKKIQSQETLDVIQGELYDAQIARVHKTISSTRMDIKLLNTYVEDRIYNVLEPLSVIANKMNIPYPHALIERALKLLFGAHAHDSLGGCNTDFVNETIYYRLLEAKEYVDNQIEVTLRQIGMHLKDKGFDAFVVNLLPYRMENVQVSLELQTKESQFEIKDSKGNSLIFEVVSQSLEDMAKIDRQILARRLSVERYETHVNILINEFEALSIYPIKLEQAVQNEMNQKETRGIENEYYEITWDKTLDLTVKETNTHIKQFITLENNGDGGDGYDYSPMVNDWVLGEDHFKIQEVIKIRRGILSSEVTLRVEMLLPKDEQERLSKKQTIAQEYDIKLGLKRDEKEISVNISLVNKIKDQRTRLRVKGTSCVNAVKTDTHFGNHLRDVVNPNLSLWIENDWVEKPVSIEHFEHYVSLNKNNTFYARGLKEYEVIDNFVYFTLFRSCAYMGRSDLVNRPGRASGMAIATPLNQLVDKALSFDFWLNYVDEHNPDRRAKQLLTPPESYQIKEINRFNLNPYVNAIDYTFEIDLDFKELTITAVKLSEKDEVVIRGYNPTESDITLELSKGWFVGNLNEVVISDVKSVIIKPYEIFTLINRGEQ